MKPQGRPWRKQGSDHDNKLFGKAAFIKAEQRPGLAGLYAAPGKILKNCWKIPRKEKGGSRRSSVIQSKRKKEDRELPETKYEKWLCIRGQVSAGPFQKPLESICVFGHRFKGYYWKFWCFDVVEKVKTSLVWILERKCALHLWYASVFV